MNPARAFKSVFIYSLLFYLTTVTESTGSLSLKGSNEDQLPDSTALLNDQDLVLPTSGDRLETILEEDEEAAHVAEPLVDQPTLEETDNFLRFNGNILVELDLNVKESTDCFTYTEDRPTKHRFYQCKKGYLFGAVKDSIYESELGLPAEPIIIDKSHPDFKEILKRSKSISNLSDSSSISTISVSSYNISNLISFDDEDPAIFNEGESSLESLFVSLELDDNQATKHIDYAFDNSDKTHVFGPHEPFLINNITKGGESIWKYDTTSNDLKFPFSVEFNGSDKFEVGFKDFYLIYTLNGQGEWVSERHLYEDPEDAGATDTKLNDNHDDIAGADENKLDLKFDVSDLELIWSFKLDTHTTSKGIYPDYVAVGPESKRKMVTMFFTDGSMRRFMRLGRFGPWKEWKLSSRKKPATA